MMVNYFGIDFGTTNSAVVAISTIDGKAKHEILEIGEDDNCPLPSFVAINKNTGEVRTGLAAKRSISDDNEYKIFTSIKSVIDEDKTWKIAGKIWTQMDIAAELFKALKQNVRDKTNGAMDIKNAVIAVPIGFSSKKRNNIRIAANKAGITVSMFVNEPTSAYCSRLEQMKKYKNVAVFDWGGGTLDVVVLRIENNVITELSTAGISLAGNDIDKMIAEQVCLKVARKTNQNFKYDDLTSEYKLRLLNLCETAKCTFANEDVASIFISNLDKYGRVSEKLDYDFFALLINNEIEQAVDCLLTALSDAGMNRESIDCIICEGGSSRLRPLQAKLLEYFDRDKLIFPRTAMWDIACGAAEIAFRPGCFTLSKPIGIIQSNGKFYPLLNIGDVVPFPKDTEQRVKFGVTEIANEARFVLTDAEKEKERDFTELICVNCQGYTDEVIEVSYRVEEDLVFMMKLQSNYTTNNYYRAWTYAELKLSYCLTPIESISERI